MERSRASTKYAVAAATMIGAALGLAGWLVAPASAQQPRGAQPIPTSNPSGVLAVARVRQQIDALNRGNVIEVMATFTDDAILTGIGLCIQNPCVGQTAIQQEIEREVADATQVWLTTAQATPPTVAGEAELRSVRIQRQLLSFRVHLRGDKIDSYNWVLRREDSSPTPAAPVSQLSGTVAELNLNDPRPCIPPAGRDICDVTRSALWNGEQDAWDAAGVTDPETRFTETVLLRVRSGDPATIRNIARAVGAPYLKVTRVQFVGDEIVQVTNLGGGAQDMTGWTLRSSALGGVFPFPSGVILQPGASCTLYTGPVLTNPGGLCRLFTGSVGSSGEGWWPDSSGEVILYYDAFALLGDDTRYSADPKHQPPPPNLQLVPSPASAR